MNESVPLDGHCRSAIERLGLVRKGLVSVDLAVWQKWWRSGGERELRVIAMERWNPLGVPDLPPDEYDAYLGRIAVRLRDGISAHELAAFLSELGDYMGVEPAPDADAATASALRTWYDSSTTRFVSELER